MRKTVLWLKVCEKRFRLQTQHSHTLHHTDTHTHGPPPTHTHTDTQARTCVYANACRHTHITFSLCRVVVAQKTVTAATNCICLVLPQAINSSGQADTPALTWHEHRFNNYRSYSKRPSLPCPVRECHHVCLVLSECVVMSATMTRCHAYLHSTVLWMRPSSHSHALTIAVQGLAVGFAYGETSGSFLQLSHPWYHLCPLQRRYSGRRGLMCILCRSFRYIFRSVFICTIQYWLQI
jgi:hypothetical protein